MTDTNQEVLMTPIEAAEYLRLYRRDRGPGGEPIPSLDALRAAVRRLHIKHVRLGRQQRFKREHLDQALVAVGQVTRNPRRGRPTKRDTVERSAASETVLD